MRRARNTRGRSCGRFTLTRAIAFTRDRLAIYRARRWRSVDARIGLVSPLYRRRDMLAAHLYFYLSRTGTVELTVVDERVASIAIVSDEDTGLSKVVVRKKRQSRKAAA